MGRPVHLGTMSRESMWHNPSTFAMMAPNGGVAGAAGGVHRRGV
jgi:hypothetical protein